MTELNQNPMNTNQRSKAPLVLFIVCILVLVIVGGYFAYSTSLNKTADVGQLNDVGNTAENNTAATNATDEPTTTDKTARDTNRYYNDKDGYSFVVPEGWITSKSTDYWDKQNISKYSDKQLTVLSNTSNEELRTNLTEYGGEMFPEMVMTYYQNEQEFINDFWASVIQSDKNFQIPQTLDQTIQKINDLKNNNNVSLDIKGWLNEILSVNSKKIGNSNYVLIERGGFGHECSAIIKNNNDNILDIYVDNGSTNCAEIPTNELSILSSLEFN